MSPGVPDARVDEAARLHGLLLLLADIVFLVGAMLLDDLILLNDLIFLRNILLVHVFS